MSQTKVSALNELTTAADDDLLLIADTSETESKKIQKSNITEENFTSTLKTKLDGIEANATADQTGAEIKTAYEGESDTNAFTDAEKTKLSGIETGADVTDATNVDAAGAVMNSDTSTASMSFVVDEDTMTSDSATKVPTQQSVKAYVDSQVQSKDALSELSGTLDDIADGTTYVKSTNDYTDAEQTKLSGIETGATADQTAQEIATAIDADATAETTLKSALGLGTAAYTASTDYATAAQGTTADSALQNVVEDTTPQLGGNLDTNGKNISFGDSATPGTDDTLTFGASNDLQIYHDSSHSYIKDVGTGSIFVGGNDLRLGNENLSHFYFHAANGGAVQIYYNGSTKLTTTADGVDINGTGALKLPVGTTAQQPASPTAGDLRWNSDDTSAEIYDGSAWGSVGGGGAAETPYAEHSNNITSAYSIASGNNAVSGGPITVGTGGSVTVPSGSTWTIV